MISMARLVRFLESLTDEDLDRIENWLRTEHSLPCVSGPRLSLEDLFLDTRSYNVLMRYVEDQAEGNRSAVLNLTATEFLKLYNCGLRTLARTMAAFNFHCLIHRLSVHCPNNDRFNRLYRLESENVRHEATYYWQHERHSTA